MLFLLAIVLFCIFWIIFNDDSYVLPIVFIILVASMLTTCVVNEEYVESEPTTHYFTALSNTTQVEGRGGIFSTTIEEEDYLIFWQDKDSHFERQKIKLDWNIAKVYEDDSEKPRIEIRQKAPKDTTKHFWFDLDSSVKSFGYNIYVPTGTVIKDIRLE